MALFDYEMRVRSKFVCAEPQHASPLQKRMHELARVHDARAPHVSIEACLGTAEATVDRISVNHYNGHVPDAPVLVGREQGELYRKAVADTGWGKQRLLAIAGAALVGVAFAAVATVAGLGLVAGLHGLHVTTLAATWGLAKGLLAVNVVADVLIFGGMEWADYAKAHKQFKVLAELCAGYLRRPHEGANARHLAADNEAIRAALGQDVWATHHAALELSEVATEPVAEAEPKAA